MKVKLNHPMRIRGKRREPGTVVDLPDELAAELLKRGRVSKPGKAAEGASADKGQTPKQ